MTAPKQAPKSPASVEHETLADQSPTAAQARKPRVARSWSVYEPRTRGTADTDAIGSLALVDEDVTALRDVDACWQVAEGLLRDRAQSDDPPLLLALRNDTMPEARAYRLKPTVERVQ